MEDDDAPFTPLPLSMLHFHGYLKVKGESKQKLKSPRIELATSGCQRRAPVSYLSYGSSFMDRFQRPKHINIQQSSRALEIY